MDRYRNLALNLYMGTVYGGLLYFVTDFSLFFIFGSTEYNPYAQYPRYFLASLLSAILYTTSLPFLKWSIAKDQYRTGLWKLSNHNNLFFSAVLPLATFTCTEGYSIWIFGPDPLMEKRFHTLIANGFFMTMLMEFGNIFHTYRNHYLEDLID